jgi:hypothetical protein
MLTNSYLPIIIIIIIIIIMRVLVTLAIMK